MAPYDRLLETARRVEGHGGAEGEDDIELLVRTFERGIAAMAHPAREPGPDEDIAALERTLAGSLESGLLLLDRKGRVLALNPLGAQLLAVPVPAPGTPLDQALAGHPELAGVLAEAVGEGRSLQRQELDLAGAEGRRTLGLTVHPLGGAAAPATTRPGAAPARAEARGYLVLFADLTEVRRQAEEQRLAERLAGIGELAAGVAHEMRNGLATLQGYLSLLQRSAGESPAGYLEEMRRETDHLHRVLADFLSFARPGSVRAEPVAVRALVERAAADPALEGVAVRVEADPAGDTVLRADPQLLERALRNLLHNAAQASREAAGEGAAAPVEVSLRVAGEAVEIAVADRGRGVPEELRERIFHPFVSGRPGGVGLGLALAHRIVHLHGGAVTLEDRPGGGTVARVRLPTSGVRFVTEGNEPPAIADRSLARGGEDKTL
jgi:signal transduction histidine kinase